MVEIEMTLEGHLWCWCEQVLKQPGFSLLATGLIYKRYIMFVALNIK
jgi:hypothetical protein